MTIGLHTLRTHQTTKKRLRVGRGTGSGIGTYSGRGIKGQKSRTGGKKGLRRRGLKQYLLQLPKFKGFKRSKSMIGISITMLSNNFTEGDKITPLVLLKRGLVPRGVHIKILGGKCTKKLSVTAHAFSATARQTIEKAGGTTRVMS